jgi:hypothetical protein
MASFGGVLAYRLLALFATYFGASISREQPFL